MTSVEYLLNYLEKINIKITCEIEHEARIMHQKEVCMAYVYGSAYGINIDHKLTPAIYYEEQFKNTNK